MVYFNRTDVSEAINVNKTSASKESDICHYWYFLNYSFKFQQNVCNTCDDLFWWCSWTYEPFLLFQAIKILIIAVLFISLISKNGAMKFMQNPDLNKKTGKL